MEKVLDMETLRKLQLVELEILIEFDRICKKYKVPYQLYSGTLLGAVRHKGFIPWDDDVDVCMLRKDYDRIIEILAKDLDEKYFLQTHKTDKNIPHAFARIRKNNTLMLQRSWQDYDMHHGIFIDIFPMDNICTTSLGGKIQKNLLYFVRKVKFAVKKDVQKMKSSNKFKGFIKLFLNYILKPISIQTFNEIETKVATIYKNKHTKYSTHLSEGIIIYYEPYMTKNDEFYNIINMEFEGHLLPVPANYDEILTSIFGDYMSFPPKEEQEPHHGVLDISFDTKVN